MRNINTKALSSILLLTSDNAVLITQYIRYYEDIQKMPTISEQDMSSMLDEESTVSTIFYLII